MKSIEALPESLKNTVASFVCVGALGLLGGSDSEASPAKKYPNAIDIHNCAYDSTPEADFVTFVHATPGAQRIKLHYKNLAVPDECQGDVITGRVVRFSVLTPNSRGSFVKSNTRRLVTSTMTDRPFSAVVPLTRRLPNKAVSTNVRVRVNTTLGIRGGPSEHYCSEVTFYGSKQYPILEPCRPSS